MAASDHAILEQVVYKNLVGKRSIGLTLVAFGWLPALAIVNDELRRMSGGNELHAAAWIAAAVLVAVGVAGVVLFVKGRNARGAPHYALLTTGASSIQTLQFVRVLNRPFVHVVVGVGQGKPSTVVFHGTAEQAVALFTRIAPQATVVPVPDRRAPPPGPSPYAR